MLLDPATFDLVQRADRMLAAQERFELADHLSPELFQSLLEVHTPVCANAAEAERHLRRLRTHVCELGRKLDLRVGSAGTHPFSLFERQRVTPRSRYFGLVEQLQYIARRELIFGLHVHVAVDDADKAIHVMRALVAHLAELVALSASSPFWRGSPTGSIPAASRSSPPSLAPGRHRASTTTRSSPQWWASSSEPAASPSTHRSGGTSGPTRATARSRSA